MHESDMGLWPVDTATEAREQVRRDVGVMLDERYALTEAADRMAYLELRIRDMQNHISSLNTDITVLRGQVEKLKAYNRTHPR
jgi:hypothetical protein